MVIQAIDMVVDANTCTTKHTEKKQEWRDKKKLAGQAYT